MSKYGKNPLFRKIAPSMWQSSGDPSVYGFIELDVTELSDKSLILPIFLMSLNDTMIKNPELTSIIKWGRVTQRKESHISVMVNIPPHKDLSALNIIVGNSLTLVEIKNQIDQKAQLIRKYKDPHLGPVLKIIHFLPFWLVKFFIKAYSFLIYELDTRLGLHFLPRQPFGAAIVSNVGSLGIKKALLPLVPLARASLMLAIGQVSKEARVHEEKICIREIIHVGVTFDHRLFDGSHAAKMLNDFESFFTDLVRKNIQIF